MLSSIYLASAHESTSRQSLLDLATVADLDEANFADYEEYIEKVFRYIHSEEFSRSAQAGYLDYFNTAIAKIKCLNKLYADDTPPAQLFEAVLAVNSEILAYIKKHPEGFDNLTLDILYYRNEYLQTTSFSSRNHQLRRLALLPIQSQPSRC